MGLANAFGLSFQMGRTGQIGQLGQLGRAVLVSPGQTVQAPAGSHTWVYLKSVPDIQLSPKEPELSIGALCVGDAQQHGLPEADPGWPTGGTAEAQLPGSAPGVVPGAVPGEVSSTRRMSSTSSPTEAK